MAYVLVVDDQKQIRSLLRALLEPIGHNVSEACNGHEALSQYHNARPDLVLTDMQMPDMDGVEMIEHLQRLDPRLKIVVMSGSPCGIQEGIRLVGAQRVIHKPFSLDQLRQTVQTVLQS